MEGRACAVSIEVDGRQEYVFESDKLREMLGASRLVDSMRSQAESLFKGNLHVFGPVSGEIRAWAPWKDRKDLLKASWEFRKLLHSEGIEHSCAWLETQEAHFTKDYEGPAVSLDPATEPGFPSLRWVHLALAYRVQKRKQAKAGVDARPACALFANCRIHGSDPANRWEPQPKGNKKEPRRQLVGRRAAAKLGAWEGSRKTFYAENLEKPILEQVCEVLDLELTARLERAITFGDLADRDSDGDRGDSYIAYVCADGDGFGRLLERLDWNSSSWGDGLKPWERNAAFSQQYNDAVEEAFRKAVARRVVTKEVADRLQSGKDSSVYLPLLPQLLGGDDLWLVCERDSVMEIAGEFARLYTEVVQAKPAVKQAVRIAGLEASTALTMSLGIAFAKAGHPAHAMVEAAESLLKSAKRLRKQKIWGRTAEVGLEGCLDWHWIESSLHEKVAEARINGWSYRSGNRVMLLTSRPWSVAQTLGPGPTSFLEAARILRRLPRRKREQLDEVLRLGHDPSLLAWKQWWNRLEARGQDIVKQANAALPAPWSQTDGQGNPTPWRALSEVAPGSSSAKGAPELAQNESLESPEEERCDADSRPEPAATATTPASVLATPWLDVLALLHVKGWEGEFSEAGEDDLS